MDKSVSAEAFAAKGQSWQECPQMMYPLSIPACYINVNMKSQNMHFTLRSHDQDKCTATGYKYCTVTVKHLNLSKVKHGTSWEKGDSKPSQGCIIS